MATIDIRAGINQIAKGQKHTKISFNPPFRGGNDQPVVTVTEWRNEPSDTVKLTTIYVMLSNAENFTIGHQVFDKPGHDAPSFGWIATTTR